MVHGHPRATRRDIPRQVGSVHTEQQQKDTATSQYLRRKGQSATYKDKDKSSVKLELPVKRPVHKNKTRDRRRKYGEVQRMYGANKSLCAEHILSGKFDEPPQEPTTIGEHEAFWVPLMETESFPDKRTKGPVLYELLEPVTVEVLNQTFGRLEDTSAGLDGVNRDWLSIADRHRLATHMNLWLVSGLSPRAFRQGYNTLAEKQEELRPTIGR